MNMKHLATSVAVAAALAFSPPVGAQPANPSGGNAMGMPGPNPGGGGLTPYTTGPAPRPMAPPRATTAPAAMAPPAGPPPAAESTSATPPSHRHAHRKISAHNRRGKGPQLTGSNAEQLNQEELARLQPASATAPGPMPPPAAAPMPGPQPRYAPSPSGGNAMGLPGPNPGGGGGLTPYTVGTPPR